MLFATSFGETVEQAFQWQTLLGALIPIAMAWFGTRFPVLLTILKALGVNINPAPAPTPAPPPADPQKLTIAQLVKLLLDMLAKRKQASKEDDDAIKALAEVAK